MRSLTPPKTVASIMLGMPFIGQFLLAVVRVAQARFEKALKIFNFHFELLLWVMNSDRVIRWIPRDKQRGEYAVQIDLAAEHVATIPNGRIFIRWLTQTFSGLGSANNP